jgi:DNA-binding transcriptional LysR family regulator
VGTSDGIEPEAAPVGGGSWRSGLGPPSSAGLIDPGLRYFLAVAQTGSISEASEQLHVAGSAISRQIARLEHEIGVRLFERHPRGMVPSEAGARLAGFVRRTMVDVEQVVGEIRRLPDGRRSQVRLAAAEGFAWDLLPEAIASFRRDQPEVDFSLHVTTSAAASENVRDGKADVAVTFSLAPIKGICVEYSQREYVHAVVNARHPIAERSSVSLAELLPYALAIVDEGTTVRQLFDVCCSAEQLSFEPVFETDYCGALYTFTKFADAVTLTGYLPVRRRLATDGLVAIPLSDQGMHRRYLQVQSMAGRSLPPAARDFVTHLVQRVQAP